MHTPDRHQSPSPPSLNLPEVYSAREVADASGVPATVVEELITGAEILTVDGELMALPEAVEAVHGIRSGRLKAQPWGGRPRVFGGALLGHTTAHPRSKQLSLLMSTGLHAAVILVVVVLTTVGLTTASDDDGEREPPRLARLIFVAEPGPGGGGGGGGLKMPVPPPKAEREGTRTESSPVPERVKPLRVEPVPEPDPPPLDNESLPPIFAPLIAAPSDSRDIRGLVNETPEPDTADDESQGPGIDGGVGSGGGTGIGSGSGSGLGEGSGGGTGGGPYRAGSGIDPPRLLHEARPRYTEEARQGGVEGDVILEIVVRSDGSIGDVRVLRRLGSGLDEQAVQAVRQWRFSAATRFGTPVDVLVEVAVEFQLR